jgi:hypothetical protein
VCDPGIYPIPRIIPFYLAIEAVYAAALQFFSDFPLLGLCIKWLTLLFRNHALLAVVPSLNPKLQTLEAFSISK